MTGLIGAFGNELFEVFFESINSIFPLLDRDIFFGGWENGDPLVVAIFRVAIPFLLDQGGRNDEIQGLLERFLDQA